MISQRRKQSYFVHLRHISAKNMMTICIYIDQEMTECTLNALAFSFIFGKSSRSVKGMILVSFVFVQRVCFKEKYQRISPFVGLILFKMIFPCHSKIYIVIFFFAIEESDDKYYSCYTSLVHMYLHLLILEQILLRMWSWVRQSLMVTVT